MPAGTIITRLRTWHQVCALIKHPKLTAILRTPVQVRPQALAWQLRARATNRRKYYTWCRVQSTSIRDFPKSLGHLPRALESDFLPPSSPLAAYDPSLDSDSTCAPSEALRPCSCSGQRDSSASTLASSEALPTSAQIRLGRSWKSLPGRRLVDNLTGINSYMLLCRAPIATCFGPPQILRPNLNIEF